MNKYSKNNKLNNLLLSIEDDLLSMEDTKEIAISEMKRYMKAFPKEPDYNIAQYGRLLISSYQVRELLTSCGYAEQRVSDDEIWERYKRQVGYVARQIISNYGES